jgi:amidase
MRFDEYMRHDGLGLAELVEKKEVSPRELVACAIARSEAVNPKLNAIIHPRFSRALEEAGQGRLGDGPFYGVPFLLKDLDGTMSGEPHNAGSRSLAGHISHHDSELVARFRKSGVVILGKTNTPEFGLVAYTEPALHGATRNPWNLDHTPGGSSGGSAAAVAAGIVPIAHAGDGGGSIRIPASHCGLFGLKPSRGRTPMGPDEAEGWHGFVSRFIVSRSVRDSAAMLDAVHGADEGAPYVAPAVERPYRQEILQKPRTLRIAFSSKSLLGKNTHADNLAALNQAMGLCAELGHEVIEARPSFDAAELRIAYLTVVAAGTAGQIDQIVSITGKPAKPSLFEPVTWFLAQVGWGMSAAKVEHARHVMARASREIARFFRDVDVFATPTCAQPPVKVGSLKPKNWELAGMSLMRKAPVQAVLEKTMFTLAESNFEATPNTMIFNITGQPAMSVPLYIGQDNLPIGTQFVGRYGDEATLLRLAAQLEEARPWMNRIPTL